MTTTATPTATRLIECVPNFSEGRDLAKIKQITDAIEATPGVTLLDVDPGAATNRTVVTFVGEPEAVIEAAFRAVQMAALVLDMAHHTGEHARMGATDVCPLVPITGVSMQECVAFARQLAERIGTELHIPVYLYEAAATGPERKNLATIRSGEYEGLPAKLADPAWQPDFGPATFNPKTGATVVGARDFLVAYNINLNTKSTRLANSVAFDVREAGRVKRSGHPITGEVERDEQGNPIRIPGKLKSVKAVGWYIEEYATAQISMNLTNLQETPLHLAFDEVEMAAHARGLRVTGSELVGLVPLNALLEAGRHFLRKQGRSTGVSEGELIDMAIRSLGLSEISAFDPQKKIIEYFLGAGKTGRLAGKSLHAFAVETASESPAPGGGSISAYMGALAAALAGMVANLSAGKRGWEHKLPEMSTVAEEAQQLMAELLKLVDDDTDAFAKLMTAFGMPKTTEAEQLARKEAIEAATLFAAEVPLRTMHLAARAFGPLLIMVQHGNPNSITDAGVGALAARSAVLGAGYNVRVNAASLSNEADKSRLLDEAIALAAGAEQAEKEIREMVEAKLGA